MLTNSYQINLSEVHIKVKMHKYSMPKKKSIYVCASIIYKQIHINNCDAF